MEEPLHDHPAAAIRWVGENTDNTIFYNDLVCVIRVDAGTGTVLRLTEASDGTWFWQRLRPAF